MHPDMIPLPRVGEPVSAETIRSLILAVRSAGLSPESMQEGPQQLSRPLPGREQYFEAVNDTGSEVPPYSVFGLKTTGTGNATYPCRMAVNKTAQLDSGLYTNKDVTIPSGSTCIAWAITVTDVVTVKKASTSGNIAIGSPCGPGNDSLEVDGNYPGLTCMSNGNAGGYFQVTRSGVSDLFGKPDGNITVGALGNVTLWDTRTNAALSPAVKVSVRARAVVLVSGKWVQLVASFREWLGGPWEC